jgi:hypothetical protein
MSAPLFPFVWQYNNQPIEQLAQDIVNVLGGSGNGPVNTANYIPVSNGLTFEDSILNTVDIGLNPVLETIFPTFGSKGFLLQPTIDRYTFGECDPAATGFAGKLVIDNTLEYIVLAGEGTNSYSLGVSQDGLVFNGEVSSTAGTSSGVYLNVKVNGVDYKLELLNP